jgi:hypothetical protein
MSGKIRYLIICSMVFFNCVTLFAQPFSGVAFINDLSEKELATVGDAVTFSVMITGGMPGDYKNNIAYLKKMRLPVEKLSADPIKQLTRSDVALLVAKLLDLDDPLMYLITKSGIYAVAACKAAGVITGPGGANMSVSGGELIDIMNAASSILETKAKQTSGKGIK